ITGIVLTKLDGTAKGGVVLAVKSEVDVPVKLIGVGESVEDLQGINLFFSFSFCLNSDVVTINCELTGISAPKLVHECFGLLINS
ncbi:hypothetical protein ACTPEF_25730, partial [Clostridioides difficile]